MKDTPTPVTTLIDKFPDFDPDQSPEWQFAWFDGFNRMAKILLSNNDRGRLREIAHVA